MDAQSVKKFDRHSLVDTKTLRFVEKALFIVIAYVILMTIFQHGFIFGVQQALNVFVIITIVREIEILFYASERKMNRADAKIFVKSDFAKITALSMSVLIPYNTPIVLVLIVAGLSVFIAKILFGGYAHKVFSPALLFYVLIKLGFANAIGASTFDNQLFVAFSNTGLFSKYVNFTLNYDFSSGFGLALSSGIFIFGIIAFILIIKNFRHALIPVIFVLTYVFGHLAVLGSTGLYASVMSVPFMFVTVFVLFDQTLIPTGRTGKVLSALLLSVFVIIFNAVGQTEAIIFGALAVQMFTPFINQCKWITSEDGTDQGKEAVIFKKIINYVLVVLVLITGIQLSWGHYGPLIGLPKVDVIQYFPDLYSTTDYTQSTTPSKDYNVSAYDTILGVYEITKNADSSIAGIVYDTQTDGRNGPIHIVIAIDPYTDTIVGYVVVSHTETQGLGELYMEPAVVDTIINQKVQNFNIDLISGATITWDALERIITDVTNNYTNENVSLNTGTEAVNVIQYFPDLYATTDYTQVVTPSKDYNVSAYNTILGVYEIKNNVSDSIAGVIYDTQTDGRNGPIHIAIAINPNIDRIVGYVVISETESTNYGAKYAQTDVIDTIINQQVQNFSIDLISGATITWDALQLVIQDVVTNYANENVSLNMGTPAVNVIQYFTDLYSSTSYYQSTTPSKDYNVSAYNTILGVYEIYNNSDSSLAGIIYDTQTQGRNGPIHIAIAVDPYTDTIVGYVVVSQTESTNYGAKYSQTTVINTIIDQQVQDFSIDLISGATITWNALQLMIQDVVSNYTNEGVSLK